MCMSKKSEDRLAANLSSSLALLRVHYEKVNWNFRKTLSIAAKRKYFKLQDTLYELYIVN